MTAGLRNGPAASVGRLLFGRDSLWPSPPRIDISQRVKLLDEIGIGIGRGGLRPSGFIHGLNVVVHPGDDVRPGFLVDGGRFGWSSRGDTGRSGPYKGRQGAVQWPRRLALPFRQYFAAALHP